jgi:hypothetical protein
VKRGGDLERPVVSGAGEEDEARRAHLRSGIACSGDGKEGLAFAPDERCLRRQVGESREETIGLGEARDRKSRRA